MHCYPLALLPYSCSKFRHRPVQYFAVHVLSLLDALT
jgi:hypothetical protein